MSPVRTALLGKPVTHSPVGRAGRNRAKRTALENSSHLGDGLRHTVLLCLQAVQVGAVVCMQAVQVGGNGFW